MHFFKIKPAEAAHKPNSVPDFGCPKKGNDHSSEDVGCPAPFATYPGTRTGRSQAFLYMVLHQVGFAKLPRSPGELVCSYHTISPLPGTQHLECRAVYFLLHFPSRCRDSTLWSTLPCGVRTFLWIIWIIQRSFVLLRPISKN